MILFAIICLAIIIILIQHLLNWLWRSSWKDGNNDILGLSFIASIVGLSVVYICFYYIVKWGCILIN
jgi:hypothetical protein